MSNTAPILIRFRRQVQHLAPYLTMPDWTRILRTVVVGYFSAPRALTITHTRGYPVQCRMVTQKRVREWQCPLAVTVEEIVAWCGLAFVEDLPDWQVEEIARTVPVVPPGPVGDVFPITLDGAPLDNPAILP